MRLREKWIVITGGSSGIGAQLARQAVIAGNRVTIVAHEQRGIDTALATLRSAGSDVDAIACDLARHDDVQALVESLLGSGRSPDVLVNNAGFGTYTPFVAASSDEIERLISVNLIGHLRLTHGLLPAMVQRRSGAVCFITSIAGRLPITPNATYCAAKHGMMGLAEALRYEVRRFGVEISAVCPGRVETPFFDHPTFRERTRGPENRSSVPVERVASAIIGAIETARPVTYVPPALGFAAWLYDALPPVTRPLYSRIMKARIERLYADLSG